MKASQCEPNVAQYAYETHLIPKLKYQMPLTLFSRDQWKTILWPARSATLQKMGMTLCFPKDALYGTQEFNGFKFKDPYEMQGIAKLTLYLQETANSTDTGKWLIATAEGLQLEIGFNVSTANLHWEAVD